MRLIPLEVGRLETAMRIITGDDTTATFPIPSWLIEHPQGLVLFDTGLHRELQHDVTRIGRSAKAFRPDFPPGEELTARLTAVGVRPADITHIVFSHLHFDHAGGTAEIPDARIVVQTAEWAAGHDASLVDNGTYNPDDFDHGHAVQTIDGVHDLFGDGRIVCVPTPGHTPGHQALRVALDSGPVVLTGDCIYFEEMLDRMIVPRFGHDATQQLASMAELRRMRDDEGCRLFYGHDLAQLRSLPAGWLR